MTGRRPSAYTRRRPVREPYELVLIVCEGSKTEPNYFRGLRTAYGLSNASVIVMPADRNDPMSIVRYAEKQAAEDQYDKAFCVFDRNGHANYDRALRHAANCPLGRQGRLNVIASVPCFEVWILLHFGYTSSAFERAGMNRPVIAYSEP